jgi:hypothetical protein
MDLHLNIAKRLNFPMLLNSQNPLYILRKRYICRGFSKD